MTLFRFIKSAALTALLSIIAVPALAQSLSTTYAGGNNFAGNTFDISPNKNIQIDGFDIHLSGSAEFATIAIYWRNGTANGFQDSAAGWTLLGTANVAPQGLGVPTHVPIGGLSMTAGQTYGIYLDVQNHGGFNTQDFLALNYSNGGPSNYSNADLVLTTFHGKGTPAFTGPSFFPRQWNGTVYYTQTQTCASEGYTGTKLYYCVKVCESGYTGAYLDTWIRRWLDRYGNPLPYCAREPQK